ncbi:family 20 glycosylhydrolase [[Ruminococcus] torques]|nr:family 20 glycosylhydrolase [[Ruminococcus] torques]
MDVGRKTFTMDWLEDTVKQMSWYKMNDFQIHLNDNLIPLEHYSQIGEDPMQAYSAFRLESDIKEGGKDGLYKADLTSKDVFYTKDEFRNLIQESRVYGVDIVPEIDTPAHSLALTKVRPDLRHGTYGRDNDHLALKEKYDESLEFVQSIFNEYMGKDLSDPVFDKDTVVHVGADEYTAAPEAYRKFADDMLKYVQDSGRTPRIWGSLSTIKGETSVRSEGVQMNLWNFGWANMDKMYEQGYDLINCNDGNYYIVPNAGYYYDYLNEDTLYNLAINSIGGVTIPAGDKQMIGGAIAVWNDMTDYLENGVSEYDVYDRIDNEIALFGAKLWGKGNKDLSAAKKIMRRLEQLRGQTLHTRQRKTKKARQFIIRWII